MTDTWTQVEPLTDEPADRTFWREPWEPQIGDKVRIRLSGECRVEGPGYLPSRKRTRIVIGHVIEEEGLTGEITRCKDIDRDGHCEYALVGHPHVVKFDKELLLADLVTRGDHFAACELERLP